MIGRNDPCPCGSGKKYKKCCALKTGISNEQLVDEELKRILNGYFENAISLPADYAEYDRYERQWRSGLAQFFRNEEIEQVTGEYYLFIARRDIWRRHVVKELNGTVRSDTRRLLDKWNDPIILLGKVKETSEETVLIEQILDNEMYKLPLSPDSELAEGDIVFGIALYDDRNPSTNVYLINGLYRVADHGGLVQRKIEELAESSGLTNSFDFYKEHMMDVYKILLSRVHGTDTEEMSVADVEKILTDTQRQVLEISHAKLDEFHVEESMKQLLTLVFTMFCQKEEPIIRKPEVLAASLFKTAHEVGVLGDAEFTQTDVAKMFGVSVSSMMKNVDKLAFYLAEALRNAEGEQGPQFAYSVGTNPRQTERVNWEMYCKMEQQSFDSFEEAKRFMDSQMNVPFHPTTDKERAQAICYDAYEEQDEEKAKRLIEQARSLDPECIDTILLSAEFEESKKKRDELYNTAILIGEKTFSTDVDNPWGLVTNRPFMRALYSYGVQLFEDENYLKAALQFDRLLQLSPTDNQGARFLSISSHLHAGNLERANKLLNAYVDDGAVWLYLRWLFELKAAGEEWNDKVERVFQQAVSANPHVEVLMKEGYPKLPYPGEVNIVGGSAEEAAYIWKLL